MEAEDDMIVLVVVDDDEKTKSSEKDFRTCVPSETCIEVDNIIETAQKHGEYITIKLEAEDDELQCDYLEDGIVSKACSNNHQDIKEEVIEEEAERDDDDEEYFPEDESSPSQNRNRHRFAMLKPWQQRSFVSELREQYDELREDEELLINTLGRIMRTVKPPPPPPDFFIMNGIMFECVCCGFISESQPAASRHYQEKHGQRYLVCYACGVDFRSTTNLYKHEKRCIAPDAEIVLRARAVFLGRKGRGRPFLTRTNKFPCSLCSAVFISKSNLESHENLHRGERPYQCHACPCAYTSYSALSRHAKKHTDAEYICDHCSRSFKVKAALVAHLDTHKPMRKHGCEECNRRFAQKSALMLHVNRVHKNLPPPCACQICPMRYPRMSLLKAHMKRAHGMSIITRKMFFKSLPTMTELEIKESKVILKYKENEMLAFPPRPIKAEPERTEEFLFDEEEEEFEEVSNEMEEETKETEEMSMDDFLQYVSHGVQDPGTDVAYIQNGQVLQSFNSSLVTRDSNLYLEVEALVDGQIIVKPCSDERLSNLTVGNSL